jgi:hypothetical protein
MRKRSIYRVCRCTPNGRIEQLETRLLVQMVNHDVHAIRCARYGGQKALVALRIGRLLEETGHDWWAVRLWLFAIGEIHAKDYDDWIDVWFNDKYVSFHEVISDGSCAVLGRCVDEVERRHGWSLPQGMDSWEYRAGDGWYDSFRFEKFDCDWHYWRQHYLDMRDAAIDWQQAAQLFRDGQGDLPPQAQDFFLYWTEDEEAAHDVYFKVDDWD